MSINYSDLLKQALTEKAIQLGVKGIKRKSAFIFDDISDNFHPESYKNIKSGSNNHWNLRLDKKHSSFNNGILEMQSSNSSDALLMNIFCHPRIKTWKGVSDLLNVDYKDNIVFGWKDAEFENETRHPTEVDMKIGNHLFESKLTEVDFTKKELATVLRYQYIQDIFDIDKLKTGKDEVKNYQLIRIY